MPHSHPIRKWTIYKITSPSGRVYIGKTCNINKRITSYRSNDCKTQRLLYKSLLKYGFTSHTLDIIESFEGTLTQANSKEIFWIRTNMSFYTQWPENKGMNLTKGGGGVLGRVVTEENRIKSRECIKFAQTPECIARRTISMRGKKRSEAFRKNRSIQMMGNKRSLGTKLTDEQKIKRTASVRKYWGVPIVQYDLSMNKIAEYQCYTEAAEKLNIPTFGISNSVNKGCIYNKQFIFKRK